jgi:hypothetical protein
MSDLQAVQPALDAYHNTYRNPTLKRLRLSDLYALFPSTASSHGFKPAGSWPGVWPNVDNPGVYLVFDANLKVLYVGKASLTQNFGTRLAEYFQYEKSTGSCEVRGGWSRRPEYVGTIPVEAAFEAPSLEEYLIQELCPSDNTVGRKHR